MRHGGHIRTRRDVGPVTQSNLVKQSGRVARHSLPPKSEPKTRRTKREDRKNDREIEIRTLPSSASGHDEQAAQSDEVGDRERDGQQEHRVDAVGRRQSRDREDGNDDLAPAVLHRVERDDAAALEQPHRQRHVGQQADARGGEEHEPEEVADPVGDYHVRAERVGDQPRDDARRDDGVAQRAPGYQSGRDGHRPEAEHPPVSGGETALLHRGPRVVEDERDDRHRAQ